MLTRILITAGPTQEAIDPVRYLTNRSSGKMGYAIAQAAASQGHRVLLISGPTQLDIPEGVDYIPVESALEMYEAVEQSIAHVDIAIFAAAVADYRPLHCPTQKIKKSGETMTLELIKNPDILASCRDKFQFKGTLIGFAAETQNLEENARSKLVRKKCDLIVGNDVSRKDIGFDSDHNEVLFVQAKHSTKIDRAEKSHLSHLILDTAIKLQQEQLA